MDVDDFLEHHGVKGMHWGVRNKRSTIRPRRSTKGYSKDAKLAASIRNKSKKSPVKVKALSNQEINAFLNRVSLESRFNESTSVLLRGRRAVINLLGIGSTMNDVAKFSDSKSGQALKQGLKKAKKAKE